MTREDLQQWLDRYVAAWESAEPEAIGELFSEDATYSYRPWRSEDETVIGRDAIVASWLEDTEDPSEWEAEYSPYAVDGDRAVAVGRTRYVDEDRTYHNAFLLRFDTEGQCCEFREFFVRQRR